MHLRVTYLVEGHQLLTIHLLGLVQRSELDILGWQSIVGERALDSAQVMGTNRNQGSLTGQVLVKLILKRNEGFITRLVELDSAQDGAGDVGSDSCGLSIQLVSV